MFFCCSPVMLQDYYSMCVHVYAHYTDIFASVGGAPEAYNSHRVCLSVCLCFAGLHNIYIYPTIAKHQKILLVRKCNIVP